MFLRKDNKLLIAGHRGMVGSAIWRSASGQGYSNLLGNSSEDLDLRDRSKVFRYFELNRPDGVILAAARVGGIMANDSYPVDFLSDNIRIQTNVMDAAIEFGVERLVFLGSSCIYPKYAEQPMREDYILTGALESTNEAYAIAKLAGVKYVQSARKQHGRRWISLLPTNLYGPGDKYSLEDSHVIPGLILKFHLAKAKGHTLVHLWGDGTPKREFLHVDDLASAVILAAESYDDSMPINIGSGEEVTIAELAEVVARSVGYEGGIAWDSTFPNGTPRKLLNSERINELGWSPRIRLDDGIQETYRSARDWLDEVKP